MRETHTVQSSIFDSYSEHEHSVILSKVSELLDQQPQLLALLGADLISLSCKQTGSSGLSVESVLRCLLLKQTLNVSYQKLAFHLSDSITYRSFTRLGAHQYPSRAGLQSVIHKIKPETLQQVNQMLCVQWHDQGIIDCKLIRIDSTVVEAHIAPPSDSKLLGDCIRVLSRRLATCQRHTGLKLRFTDQRPKAKRLVFAVFYAKMAEKQAPYPPLLSCASIVLKQVNRALSALDAQQQYSTETKQWLLVWKFF